MAAAKPAGRASAPPARPKLPEPDVARFEELARLVEDLVERNQALFIAKGEAYRATHREASRRPLTAQEASQIAAAVIDDPRPVEDRAVAFQGSELSAYDDPDGREVLLAAGVATAPVLIEACRRVVALVEMPTERFWEAIDADALQEAIDEDADALRRVPMADLRQRTAAAMGVWAQAAGTSPGKALGLIARNLWAALEQAMRHLGYDGALASSSLTDSPPPTTGPDATSSDSAGERPAS